MHLTDAQKNRLLCDVLGDHGEIRLDLGMDGVCRPFDDTPHAMFVQAVCTCLQDLVSNRNAPAPSPLPSGTADPQPTGVVSFQAGTGCECPRKHAPEGNTGEVPTGKSMGCGRGSHEPEGQACLDVHTRCSFCCRLGHTESVCHVKCATQLATSNSCSALASTRVGTCSESCNTINHLLTTPHTVPTVATTGTLPQTTSHSRGPEGDDPKGNLHGTPQSPPPGPRLMSDPHRGYWA